MGLPTLVFSLYLRRIPTFPGKFPMRFKLSIVFCLSLATAPYLAAQSASSEGPSLQDRFARWNAGESPYTPGELTSDDPDGFSTNLREQMGTAGMVLKMQKPSLAARAYIQGHLPADFRLVSLPLKVQERIRVLNQMVVRFNGIVQSALTAPLGNGSLRTQVELRVNQGLQVAGRAGLPTSRKGAILNTAFISIVVMQEFYRIQATHPEIGALEAFQMAISQSITTDLLCGVIAYNLGSQYGKSLARGAVAQIYNSLKVHAPTRQVLDLVKEHIGKAFKSGLGTGVPALATLASNAAVGTGHVRRSDTSYNELISTHVAELGITTEQANQVFERYFRRNLAQAFFTALDPDRMDYMEALAEGSAGLIVGTSAAAVTKNPNLGIMIGWAASQGAVQLLQDHRDRTLTPRDLVEDFIHSILDDFERTPRLPRDHLRGRSVQQLTEEEANRPRQAGPAAANVSFSPLSLQKRENAAYLRDILRRRMDAMEALQMQGLKPIERLPLMVQELRAWFVDLGTAILYYKLDLDQLAQDYSVVQHGWLTEGSVGIALTPEQRQAMAEEMFTPLNQGGLPHGGRITRRGQIQTETTPTGETRAVTLFREGGENSFETLRTFGITGAEDEVESMTKILTETQDLIRSFFQTPGNVLDASTFEDSFENDGPRFRRSLWLHAHGTAAYAQALEANLAGLDKDLQAARENLPGGLEALPDHFLPVAFLYREAAVSRVARYHAAAYTSITALERMTTELLPEDILQAAELQLSSWVDGVRRAAGRGTQGPIFPDTGGIQAELTGPPPAPQAEAPLFGFGN